MVLALSFQKRRLLWLIRATRGQHNTVYVDITAPAAVVDDHDDDDDEEDFKSSSEFHNYKKKSHYHRLISCLSHRGEYNCVMDRNGQCTVSSKHVQNRKKTSLLFFVLLFFPSGLRPSHLQETEERRMKNLTLHLAKRSITIYFIE